MGFTVREDTSLNRIWEAEVACSGSSVGHGFDTM